MSNKINRSLYEMHAEICKVLTSAKRIEILNLLRDGERAVSELAEIAGISQTNVSQHLAFLRQKRMVVSRREGSNIFYSVTNPKIFTAMDTMKEVLMEQLQEERDIVAGMGKTLA